MSLATCRAGNSRGRMGDPLDSPGVEAHRRGASHQKRPRLAWSCRPARNLQPGRSRALHRPAEQARREVPETRGQPGNTREGPRAGRAAPPTRRSGGGDQRQMQVTARWDAGEGGDGNEYGAALRLRSAECLTECYVEPTRASPAVGPCQVGGRSPWYAHGTAVYVLRVVASRGNDRL